MMEWKGSMMPTVIIEFKMDQNFDQNSTQPAQEKEKRTADKF
jgi:hypothetical protein